MRARLLATIPSRLVTRHASVHSAARSSVNAVRSAAVCLAICVVSVTATSIGCRSKMPETETPIAGGRSYGFSKDDKARCEFVGRLDRESVDTKTGGAIVPNVRRVYQTFGEGAEKRRVLTCREVDVNLDGIKDVLRTYNDQGEPWHEEADTNFDGRVDSWITFSGGRVVRHEIDTNGDGEPDVWKTYTQGVLARVQRDTNFDGKPDVWEIYVRGELDRIGFDIDFDGRVDRWDRDEMGRIASETKKSEEDAKKRAPQPDEDDDAD